VSPSASSSSQDQLSQHLPKSVIPTHHRATEQLTKNWAPFKVLRQCYASTRFEEQRQLHLPQKHKATVADSTLCVEMSGLEDQADNAKARELFWEPLSWLGTIRPTSANDAFDPALWETFVSTMLGLGVPILAALPRLKNSPLAKCGCKKFCMDFHGDHTSMCTAHSGATKAHDWMVSVLGPLFRTAGHLVRTQYGVTASAGQRRGDVEVRSYLRDQAGSRSLVFDLSITHDRFGSSSHVQQNGSLSHPQDLDGPMRVATQRKTNAYKQTYVDNQNISFLLAIMSTSNSTVRPPAPLVKPADLQTALAPPDDTEFGTKKYENIGLSDFTPATVTRVGDLLGLRSYFMSQLGPRYLWVIKLSMIEWPTLSAQEKKLHAAMRKSFVTSYAFGAEAILQHWLWKTLKNATKSFGPLLKVFATDYDATTTCGTDAWESIFTLFPAIRNCYHPSTHCARFRTMHVYPR
jgi:hypothetical protein